MNKLELFMKIQADPEFIQIIKDIDKKAKEQKKDAYQLIKTILKQNT